VGGAFGITVLALLAYIAVVGIVTALGGGGPLRLAEALGLVVGFGGIGTLAARQVPPPQAERLGLRAMPLRFLLPLLLLLPVALLSREVDNVARVLLARAPGAEIAGLSEKLTPAGVLEMLEGAILTIGIQPVVWEWFFRGVVQQGVVTQLGMGRGIVIAALLYALALSQGAVGTSFVLWVAATLSEFVNAIVYGLARHYSGSLLAPILLHLALAAGARLALGLAPRFPIPGFNAAGLHTPVQFLLPAAASVALGIALLVRSGGGSPSVERREAGAGKGESAPR
jgi:hypothetical protein